ncbi:alkaline phosphatase [Pedobacter metabolipauper]|uniref:Alkaline phosphatase n=1 Tax=Pedobacter metabolipauper TaxID=425513 RepID=A0A4R6SWX0_9SPHI|nr:alkaline phosphatase [Pedobacter metabolipauper]TDQ08889.1 alkaline phosphatase [Pedobacter metabolipauper]
MKRRDFFKNTSILAAGTALAPLTGFAADHEIPVISGKTAKNIIFLVSDGMSIGTLTMANLFIQRRDGRSSHWLSLYEQQKAVRSLMDTASANALVTDSAAASSAWGGGVRVNNGSINVGADGTLHKPILQKFKAAGKSVGCVTTVPITHATPAGFCVNSGGRDDQEGIALQYLDLRFDVMMGGGTEFFSADKRQDKKDLFESFKAGGFSVLRNRQEMLSKSAADSKPVLGVFHEDGLPYTLDRNNDSAKAAAVPTLAEMTDTAIKLMEKNKKGFVLQVEGGRVDWGAHANDTGGLIYDQVAFDEAVGVAIAFAEKNKDTLIILTTDHGNANPGLFSAGGDVNANFDKIKSFKHTNDWILNGITSNHTPKQVIERIEAAQGLVFKQEEAASLLTHYQTMDGTGLYNPKKLPFKLLAEMQVKHTSVSWGSMGHSGDYVELAMYGPGSEMLKPMVKNTDLHQLMLRAAGLGA